MLKVSTVVHQVCKSGRDGVYNRPNCTEYHLKKYSKSLLLSVEEALLSSAMNVSSFTTMFLLYHVLKYDMYSEHELLLNKSHTHMNIYLFLFVEG